MQITRYMKISIGNLCLLTLWTVGFHKNLCCKQIFYIGIVLYSRGK